MPQVWVRLRRLLLFALLLLFLAAGGLGAERWYRQWRFHESTDNAYVEGEITPIAAEVAGQVVALPVADHQPVRRGELLLRIDPSEYRAALARAEAQLAAARAAREVVERRLSLAEAKMAAAAAELAAAQADLELAAKTHARAQALVRRNAAAIQTLDEAAAALARAEARVAAAQAARDAAAAEKQVLQGELAAAAAEIARAEAERDLAKIRLDDTEIRAPIDGVVGNRAVRLGQYVQPGRQLLVIVPREVWIEANFKETQIARMRPGQRVAIAVDAFPDVPLTGWIESFAPASGAKFSLLPPENATGNFTKVVQRLPVRIALPADHPLAGRLVPGLSVVVTVDTRTPQAGSAQAATTR
jgi:membrane fusion protein (multidrug efflux system)